MGLPLRIVRLNSGEELLCRVEEGDYFTVLHKAMILIPTHEGGLNFQVFMPYSNAMEDGITMPNEFIAFKVEPEEQLIDHYKTNVDKIVKIAVPEEKKIIGS